MIESLGQTMYTRRDFGKLALAALPVSAALAEIDSKIDGVQIGAQSYSFRDLSFEDALKAMKADNLGVCELFSPHIEEGKTDVAPEKAWGQSGRMDAAARKAAADKVRQ